MSTIANLHSAPAAFSTVNLHQHGHKRGGHVQATNADTDTDAGSGSPAQVPTGLRQNLFGSLLNSLEQVIGVQLSGAAAGATAAGATAGGTVAGGTATADTATADTAAADTTSGGANAAASTPNAAASPQSSIAMLQNYLNNLAHNAHTDGSPAAKSAGSGVSLSA